MGLGYELIRFAGKHDNIVTRALSAPGLWVQRITTREPTEDMLEVAIISLKGALRDENPEFMEFFKSAPWEKTEEKAQTEDPAEAGVGKTEAEPSESDDSEAEK
jgi:hypothetical protein